MSVVKKNELAYSTIKKMIISGKYASMSEIQEDDLQRELGVSRTPIREAIKQLEMEGFIKVYPRKITLVADVTIEMINEIYAVRELIEPYLNILASEDPDKEVWLTEFKRKFENRPSNYTREELKQYYINLDKELHSAILDKCSNRFIKNTMSNVYDHNQWLRVKSADPTDVNDSSIPEHTEIIDCILEGNRKAIQKVTEKHIICARERLLRFFRR